MHFDNVPSFLGIAVALWVPLSLAWLILVLKILRTDETRLQAFLRPLGVIAIVSVAVLYLPTDILSDDAFRYRWDGWVTSHGINPYASAPNDPSLQLGSAWQSVSYRHMHTIYPPGAQLVFAGVSLFAGTDPHFFKIGWLLILILLYLTLERLFHDTVRRRVLLRAMVLCPVILLNGIMDIHVDSMMALLTVIALVLYERRHLKSSAVVLALAISLKFVPFIALPFLVVPLTWRQRAEYGMIAVVVLGAVCAPFLGPHMFDSLVTFANKWQTNSASYSVLSYYMDDGSIRLVLASVAFITVSVIWFRYRTSPIFALSASLTTLLLCSPVVHPWYLTLPLILFCLGPTRAVVAWGVTMCLYGIGLLAYKGNGVWYDHPVALAFEFLPVISALVIDLWKGPLLFRDKQGADRIAIT